MNQGYITSRSAFICLKAAPQALLKVTLKRPNPPIASEGFLWWAQEELNLEPRRLDCKVYSDCRAQLMGSRTTNSINTLSSIA